MSNLRKLVFLICLLLFGLALTACGNGNGDSEETSGDISDIPGEVPQRYRELENPLAGDSEAMARGGDAYRALCSQCHGAGGKGDGQEASGFNPAPGDLTRPQMASQSDGYLYWRIVEGGAFEPFNSLMPEWGSLLSDIEIWELVSFMRALSS